jgi:hypothetical protein
MNTKFGCNFLLVNNATGSQSLSYPYYENVCLLIVANANVSGLYVKYDEIVSSSFKISKYSPQFNMLTISISSSN